MMGYNTTVVVMNDALDMIENDPGFGKNLADAIRQLRRSKTVDVPARYRNGVHCNAATVIETHHADYTVYVRVGRNYGEVVPVDEVIEWERYQKRRKRVPKSKTVQEER